MFANAQNDVWTELSIKKSTTLDDMAFSTLEMDNRNLYDYSLDSDLKRRNFSEVKIKCMGSENEYLLNYKNTEFNKNIDSKFKDKFFFEKNIYFLKKCRALTTLHLIKKNPEDLKENTDPRVAWSEYFNVIFERPKIAANITNTEVWNSYPFNTGEYLNQNSFHIFNLELKNESKKDIRINLPSNKIIKALLNPIISNGQRPDYGKSEIDKAFIGSNLIPAQLNEEFESEIVFMQNSEPVSKIILSPGEPIKIEIYVNKNFSCNMKKSSQMEPNPYSELGFRVRSIDIDSEYDQLNLEYFNQDSFDAFPEKTTLNELLEQTTIELTSGDQKGKSVNANLLQAHIARTHVIDTYVTRGIFQSPLGYPSDATEFYYSNLKKSQNKKFKSGPYFYEAYNYDQTFCKQVY